MHLSTTKNKIQNPRQNQNKTIFTSSFMTHVHYLRSVLPHSEYLKSMLLNTLLSDGCGGVCLKSQRVGDWGRTSQVQEQPGFSSTPCLRESKPLQKPVVLDSAGWVFPQVFLFWLWGGCFFFIFFFLVFLSRYSLTLREPPSAIWEKGVWLDTGEDLAVKLRFSSMVQVWKLIPSCLAQHSQHMTITLYSRQTGEQADRAQVISYF